MLFLFALFEHVLLLIKMVVQKEYEDPANLTTVRDKTRAEMRLNRE